MKDSETTSMSPRLVVAAYYRASSDEQRDSVPRQRAEVQDYAKRQGWKIFEEYIDDGKSGSKDLHKRTDFLRMIKDAEAGKFNAILCFDTSRFGRLDSIDGAPIKNSLRAHVVHLECVTGGKIDWNNRHDRIRDTFESESNNEYSERLSGNSVSGRKHSLDGGNWPHGAVPYGYRREYTYNGKVMHTCAREDEFKKPKGWKLQLQPEPKEAEIVRWIFSEYTSKDTSMRYLCHDLNNRGVPGPSERLLRTGTRPVWERQTIKNILRQKAYIGICEVGRTRRSYKAWNKLQPRQREDTCPPIVDRAVFEAAQAKMERRKETGRKVQPGRASALTGCLYCGHCGYRLNRKTLKGRVVFYCQSAFLRPGVGCHQWRIYEAEALHVLVPLLTQHIDRELLNRIHAAPPAEEMRHLGELQARAKQLEKDIANGTRNFLLAPPELLGEMQQQLGAWKEELLTVQNTLSLVSSDGGKCLWDRFSKWFHTVSDKLIEVAPERVELDPTLEQIHPRVPAFHVHPRIVAEPDVLREFLQRLHVRFTITWKANGGRFYILDRGSITAEVFAHEVNFANGDYMANRSISSAPARPQTLVVSPLPC